MPPKVALLLTLVFMAWLFWRDIRQKPNVTRAIWIPILWIFLLASQTPSRWLNILGLPYFGATSVEEGSLFDASIFFGLIVAGSMVLTKRGVTVSRFFEENPWLTLFIVYCFVAIFWSDFAFVSFKRWIKILGHPVMALVLLTEPNPRPALITAMKRCAYVVFPISILWMKYFIHLGRTHTQWGGSTICGICAGGSNALGAVSAIFALFFLWHLFEVRRASKSKKRRKELGLILFLLWTSIYCLVATHSATSTICLIGGVAVMLVLGLQSVDRTQVGKHATIAAIVFVILQLTLDIYGTVVGWTGHEATIESRGLLWRTLLQMDTDPILGTGFESFWLGERVEKLWTEPEFAYHPNEAHNGYLELYLNLGLLGLLTFVGVIFSVFRKISWNLQTSFEWGRLEMSWLVMILLRNWTEADFKGLSFPFFILFLIAVRYSAFDFKVSSGEWAVETDEQERPMELVNRLGFDMSNVG